jgi:hypothetical protein
MAVRLSVLHAGHTLPPRKIFQNSLLLEAESGKVNALFNIVVHLTNKSWQITLIHILFCFVLFFINMLTFFFLTTFFHSFRSFIAVILGDRTEMTSCEIHLKKCVSVQAPNFLWKHKSYSFSYYYIPNMFAAFFKFILLFQFTFDILKHVNITE